MSNVHLHPSPYIINIQFFSCPLCQWWVNWQTFLATVLTAAFKTAGLICLAKYRVRLMLRCPLWQGTDCIWSEPHLLTDVAQIHFMGSLFPYCIKPSVTLTSLSAWLGLDFTNIMLTDKLYLLTNFSNELRHVQMSISVEAIVCILAFHERKSDFHLWAHADCVQFIESIQ